MTIPLQRTAVSSRAGLRQPGSSRRRPAREGIRQSTSATPSSRVDHNHTEFVRLLDIAQRHGAAGRFAAASAYAQIAGEHAWLNPGGIFTSTALEQLLVDLARTVPRVNRPGPPADPPRTVLHLATEVYQTGGSTQFIAGWIENDPARQHLLCLTRQRSPGLPAKVANLPSDRVRVVRLEGERGGLLGRAAAVRRLVSRADVVLIHAHPHDVVPVLALADLDDVPPIVYVDHADHVFWIGTSVVRTLLSMRSSGARLAVDRRGIEPQRTFTVTRPLRLASRSLDRAEAKRALGIDEDAVVVLTAADASKYVPLSPPSLLEMVVPVFVDHQKAHLLAAGPAMEGEWEAAERLTNGRVRALGPIPDMTTLHHAADVYLDSFPFSSLTSLLESGSLGNPVVTYRGHPNDCAVLGADTVGVDELMLRPSTPAELARCLSELIEDEQTRLAGGEALRRAVVATHLGDRWGDVVEGVYAFAARSTGAPAPRTPARSPGELDRLLELMMAQSPFSGGVVAAVRGNLGVLPLPQRVLAAGRLMRAGCPPRPAELLSDRSRARLLGPREALIRRWTGGRPG